MALGILPVCITVLEIFYQFGIHAILMTFGWWGTQRRLSLLGFAYGSAPESS